MSKCRHSPDLVCDICEPPYRCFSCKTPVTMCEIQCEHCRDAPFIDYLGVYE